MCCVVGPQRSLPWTQLAVFAAVAFAAAGCSSESSRFTDPFNSKGGSAGREVTGSVASKPRAVQSQPLPPLQAAAPDTRAITHGAPPPAPSRTALKGWTWEGGTPVMVQPGETAATLSRRYGVPAEVIAKTNGLPDAEAIKPGQRLVIPRRDGTAVTGAIAARPAGPAPVASAVPSVAAPETTQAVGGPRPYVHVVGPGETLMKLSRKYKIPVAKLARENHIPPYSMLKIGDRITIPGLRAPQAAAATKAATPKPPAAPVKPAPVAASKPQAIAQNTAPASTAQTITPAAHHPEPPQSKADTTGTSLSFRWPVRGRVISAFGSRPSGQHNDGINVAVPQGTPIKAAEEGVVVYAGNELKTYGNLVLVRHANGYVTAYAHASEILVKRDEAVKRGQVIAKSGQTGNVSTPQVHFEIRKGSSPVDPMPYLDKGST